MNQDYIKTLHDAERELLIEVLELFERHSIDYFAIGGTLLGAVRNKGFIEWDDDIDLAVPRESYVRLIQVMNEAESENELVGMEYYKNDPELYFYPVRIVNKKYIITDSRLKDRDSHPWIDILPVDAWPEGAISGRVFKLKMLWYRFLLGLHYSDNLRDKKRSSMEKLIIGFAHVTHVGRLIDPTKVKDKIDKTLSEANYKKHKVAGTCMGAYFFKEFVPVSYFGDGSIVEFEGIDLKAPQKVDKYLKHIYGSDYMIPLQNGDSNMHTDGQIRKVNVN